MERLPLLLIRRNLVHGEETSHAGERFPEDFMFQLTKDEAEILVSQNVIPFDAELGWFAPYASRRRCHAPQTPARHFGRRRVAASR
jgi:hypothetical protein